MGKRASTGIVLTLLLVSMLTMAFNVQPAKAESPLPYFSFNPMEYTAHVGESFTIDVNITDVTNILGYEFQLWYNSTIINATGVTPGPVNPVGMTYGPGKLVDTTYVWAPLNGNYTTYFGAGDVNGDGHVGVLDAILVMINYGTVPPMPPVYDVNGDGFVGVKDLILIQTNSGPVPDPVPGGGRVWVMAPSHPSFPFNGSGTIMTISFTALALGNSTLHLNGTVISDLGGNPIAHTALDGSVTVGQPIKIGVIGPMAWMQGQGMKEGAEIARDEINAGGGILGRNVELVFADTLRGYPEPNASTGVAAATELVNAGCDFAIGGFNSEAVSAAREVFMDNKTIFLITGAPEGELVDCGIGNCTHCVRCNYTRYKYTFRVSPVNGTTIAKALWNFTRFAIGRLLPYVGVDGKVKVAVVSEDLTMWDEMHWYMTTENVYNQSWCLGPYAKVTNYTRVSPTATNFSAVLQNVSASGTRLLIHLFSTPAGIDFIQQWKDMGVNAIPVGINLLSQNTEMLNGTAAKCEYETILTTIGTRTPLSAKALAFYDETLSRYGHAPIYTSWGAYEAIYVLKEAIEAAGTIDADAFIPILEQTDRNGTLGRFKFRGPHPMGPAAYATYMYNATHSYLDINPTMMGTLHDVFCNEVGANWEEGYVRPLVCQWQKSPVTGKGRLQVVYPRYGLAASFARKWKIPTWMAPRANFDVFPDGVINIFDLIYTVIHYGTKAGDPDWNSECDIDGNGIINVLDFIKIALNFGPCGSQSQSMVGVSEGTASTIPKITQTNPETTVYLDPPTINGTEIGQVFRVNITISDASDVVGWQAGLTFNHTLLECTGFSMGETWSGLGHTYYPAKIHNDTGVVDPGACVFSPPNFVNGNGTLAYATFRVNKTGVSDIHLRDVIVTDPWEGETFTMVPFNIIDTYTVTRSAAQTSVTVSNSTGVQAYDDYTFVFGMPELIKTGSGFYGHAFSHPDKQISFNVTGPYPGWSNVTIPKTLINVSTPDQLLVTIDNVPLETEERTVTENDAHYFVYFNYTLGTHSIRILKRPPVCNVNTTLYYATIQEAINAPETVDGHKILAFAGIHPDEHVVVNKSVSLIGENKHNTTIDGGGTGTVIKVTAPNVNITNLTIQNSGHLRCGILVDGSSGNNISNNIITNNYYGIRLVNSSGNILADNNMSGNEYNFGLYGAEASHFNNTIDESNTVDGKPVYYIKKASNTVYNSSTNAGTLYLINCDSVTVRDLTLTKNVNGIFFWNTTNSKIQNVNASNNLNGIYLQGQSNNNNLTDNTVSNNELGIHLDSSNDNRIYHNSFIENSIQAMVTGSYNTLWNASYSSGGGNYWSDHSIISPFVYDEFKGVNQDVQGNDGIIDDPKEIDKENQDKYPLVSPLAPPVYNLNTHQGYTKIQKAINVSNALNTIIVRNGTYSEQVTIDKPLTIIGIIGSTFINGTGTVVTITANDVTLRGFTIQGSGSTDKGILLSHANNVVISENTITKRGYGIWLNYSDSCRISGNTINNNAETGIHLEYSDSANISRNTITNNSFGIYLIESSYNDFHRNNVKDNDVGIYLWRSSNNVFYHNNFNNTPQVSVFPSSGYGNTWDNGAEGNYWSDYNGTDLDGNGIGDIAYNVTDTVPVQQDRYPLMKPWAPKHDVAVVHIPPSRTYRGFPVSITVTVENQGDYTEKFNVTAYNDTCPIATQTITVTSESSTTVTFTWDTTGVPCGKYTISANATQVPGENETDLDDNTRASWVVVTCLGDVDDNYEVNVMDVILVCINLGPVPPKPPRCDVNRDGEVNVLDVILCLINLGPC